MAAKIKLKRLGKIRNPQYRIVVADARNKRDGRAIEELGLELALSQPTPFERSSRSPVTGRSSRASPALKEPSRFVRPRSTS